MKEKKAGHSLEQFIPFEKDYSCWENDDASDIGESCILARSTMHTRDCTIFSRWYDKNWGWDAKMPRELAIIVSRRLIFSFFFLNLAKNATRRCGRWEKRKGRQRVSLLNLSLRRKRRIEKRTIYYSTKKMNNWALSSMVGILNKKKKKKKRIIRVEKFRDAKRGLALFQSSSIWKLASREHASFT